MIVEICGLDSLRQLRVLNLEFNQIRVLAGLERLGMLEELYVAYNEIEEISNQLINNNKLRILHLAYNDIHNLESISVLFQPSFVKSGNSLLE
jgi:Leucine-rich repeat (LRR) protein